MLHHSMYQIETSAEIDKYDTSLTWINPFIPNDFDKYYNSQFNSIKLNWDGTEDKVNDVLLTITRDIIDYNYLVRFQIFKVKWFVYNFLRKMLYIAMHKDYYISKSNKSYNIDETTLSTVKSIIDTLNRIPTLPLPYQIKSYLEDIFFTYLFGKYVRWVQ